MKNRFILLSVFVILSLKVISCVDYYGIISDPNQAGEMFMWGTKGDGIISYYLVNVSKKTKEKIKIVGINGIFAYPQKFFKGEKENEYYAISMYKKIYYKCNLKEKTLYCKKIEDFELELVKLE